MLNADKITPTTRPRSTNIPYGVSRAAPATDMTIETADRVMKIAYRVSEATVVTGLSRSSLYLAIQSGALRVKKCGRRTLILREDLIEFLRALP